MWTKHLSFAFFKLRNRVNCVNSRMKFFHANNTSESLCLFILVNCISVFYGIPRETRCKRRQGWRKPVNGYLTETADDRFRCIRQCLSQPECLAIEYNDDDKACTFYKWDQLRLQKNTAEQGITFVREASVVAIEGTVRYEYNFNQAVDVLVSFGGELTKYEDLHNAWQSGMSHCSFGWVFNGSCYYTWALPTDGNCYHGVIDCSPSRSHADAYCVV